LDRDTTREPSRRLDLQPVGKEADLNEAALATVVTVGDGIEQGFANGNVGVFGPLLAPKPFDQADPAHRAVERAPRGVDHLWNAPFELTIVQVERSVGPRGLYVCAGEVEKGYGKRREKLLRYSPEEKY